jgi:hypothetical protein
MQRLIKMFLVLTFLVLGTTSAFALPTYVTAFDTTYPAAASIGDCALCHVNPAGGGTRTSYGNAFLAAGHSFTAIESKPSKCTGYTNLQLINLLISPGSGTCPTPPPPATCTSFTYSAWGACQPNNTQTRTVASSLPAGCTGGTPVTSQSCTYVPPTCSYTYSAWGTCQSNNTQTRTVTSVTPAGCTGTPVTSQACTFVPPPPPIGTIPLPVGEHIFTYAAVPYPVVSMNPAKAKPIGVGPVATGGDTLNVNVNVGPFAGTVNISLTEYAPSYGTRIIFSMDSTGHLRRASAEDIAAWKADVTKVHQHAFGPIAVSKLKKGFYTLTLTATPSGSSDEYGNGSDFYQWTTHFTVQ